MERSRPKGISESTIDILEPGQGYLAHAESVPDSSVGAPKKKSSKTGAVGLTRERSASRKRSCIELPKELLVGKLVDCIYKTAGCTVKLPKGSLEEKEHHRNCQFRPIPCLMHHICSELVPYPYFLLHHMKHYLIPTFSSYLDTNVYFDKEDFESNNRWQPRWMNCYKRDFFVLISHRLPGIWYFWVWMLGTIQEAEEFFYDIEISKGENRKMGTFPILSLRTGTDEIEKKEICLSLTDHQVKRISQIGDNLVGSFELDVVIYKNKAEMMPSRLCLQ